MTRDDERDDRGSGQHDAPPSAAQEAAGESATSDPPSGADPGASGRQRAATPEAEDESEAFEHAAEAPTAVWSTAFPELEADPSPAATAPSPGDPVDTIQVDESLAPQTGSPKSLARDRGPRRVSAKQALSWLGVVAFALVCGAAAYFLVRILI